MDPAILYGSVHAEADFVVRKPDPTVPAAEAKGQKTATPIPLSGNKNP
jgi:hypothetical protein